MSKDTVCLSGNVSNQLTHDRQCLHGPATDNVAGQPTERTNPWVIGHMLITGHVTQCSTHQHHAKEIFDRRVSVATTCRWANNKPHAVGQSREYTGIGFGNRWIEVETGTWSGKWGVANGQWEIEAMDRPWASVPSALLVE